MSLYETLRHFADSYGLIFMGATFGVLVGWAFLPGGRAHSDRAATMIFEEDETNG
jgi:cytochrome c oxidase cbb3-type subunit IV